jgi:PHD/YefM family antitoxin component YafN of YafNO toxin-antitoxin module
MITRITGENLHPQYVTDRDGHQTAVILPIEEYNSLLEDLEDLAVVAERVNEPNLPHEKVLEELKDDGYLSD